MRKLVVSSGSEAGRELEIDRELVVGRGDVDVVTDDEEMSRRHAVLRPTDGGVEIEDLGSSNGTYVNGQRITAPLTVADHAAIRMGESEFTVEVTLPDATKFVVGLPHAPPVTRMLRVTSGRTAGREFEVDRELVVGRHNADVTVEDSEMSRHHAALRPVSDGVEVEDLGSRNGTFVDGRRISAPLTISLHGTITMGVSEFVVDVRVPADGAAASAPGKPAPPPHEDTDAPPQPAPTPDTSTADLPRSTQILARTRLFQGLSAPVLLRITQALQPLDVAKDETLVREGDPLERFYIVESGTILVTARYGAQTRELARFGPGDFFGEIALLQGVRSRSTIRAETRARLQTLTPDDFNALIKHVPQVAAEIDKVARTRKGVRLAVQLEAEHSNIANLLEDRGEMRIGRSADNDLVFRNPTISRHHAVIRLERGKCRLTDLRSTAGTFVNGTQIRGTVDIVDGDEISVGEYRFVFDRGHAAEPLEPQGARIDIVGVSKQVGTRTLLHDVTLTVLPGELVAIVGGSGAGKTTLLDAMSGVRPATSGQVLYDGRDYYEEIAQYRHTLGYVPQDDIIHMDLPLRLTLKHSARLRLPRDTPSEEIEGFVDDALESLGLTGRAGVPVKKLSGGQRKRASIGIELLSEPRIFYLDEPTSGLDPGTDRQMMQLLRKIADEGRTVILTTHATANVRLCDKITVLARDGYLAYFGPPDDALCYFGVEHFDEIYDRVADELTPEEWGRRFNTSETWVAIEAAQEAPRAAAAARTQHGRGLRFRGPAAALHQLRVLSRRNFDLARQPRNLMPRVMQPIILTAMLLALFRTNPFSPTNKNPNAALQLLFTLCFTSFLFGLLFGVQQIVKERAIFLRERMVNLGILPYLLSKTSFLAPLLVIANILIPLLLWSTGRLPAGGFHLYFDLILTLCLTSFAGLCMALLISSIASSSQAATDLLSPWIAPQVLFAGALLAITAMNTVGRGLATITAVRWSFEGAVSSVHLKADLSKNTSPIAKAILIQYRAMFNSAPRFYWLALVAFIGVPLVLAEVVLAKKSKQG